MKVSTLPASFAALFSPSFTRGFGVCGDQGRSHCGLSEKTPEDVGNNEGNGEGIRRDPGAQDRSLSHITGKAEYPAEECEYSQQTGGTGHAAALLGRGAQFGYSGACELVSQADGFLRHPSGMIKY